MMDPIGAYLIVAQACSHPLAPWATVGGVPMLEFFKGSHTGASMINPVEASVLAVGIDAVPQDTQSRIDAVYAERNHLVAALAHMFRSGIRKTSIDGWGPEWHGCVYIDLPTGQVSYHYHDRDAQMFADLPPYPDFRVWDGHDKDCVHRRLDALRWPGYVVI